MKPIKNAVYTEKWTDRNTGEEKKKYTTIGTLFQRDDGSMCLKMLGSWVNFYDIKPRRDQVEKVYNEAKQAVSGDTMRQDFDDDIPFAPRESW